MKLTESQLRQIIREELMNENDAPDRETKKALRSAYGLVQDAVDVMEDAAPFSQGAKLEKQFNELLRDINSLSSKFAKYSRG